MIKFLDFTDVEQEFINTYVPEDRCFTSVSEIDKISEVFNLMNRKNNELQALRNSIVKYYSDIENAEIEKEGKITDNIFYRIIPAMQSITSVIDMYKYKAK